MGNSSLLLVLSTRLIALLRDAGIPLGGFVTDEIRAFGRRAGFAVETVRAAVLALLDQDVPLVATVQLNHHPFTDALKGRRDVRLLRVSERSRDALPERLAAELRTDWAAGRGR